MVQPISDVISLWWSKLIAMKLTSVIRERGMPQGDTQAGTAWMLKALHPADAVPPWTGIPDGRALPTVIMEYEALLRVTPSAGSAGTYTATAYLLPNPVQPLSVITVDNIGTQYLGLRNPTVNPAGGDMGTACDNFSALCGAYRMIYQSATWELDAPELYDNGTVVAAQIPMLCQEFNPTLLPTGGGASGKVVCGPHIHFMNYAANKPDYTSLSSKPLTYSGLAKDGVYQVLRQDTSLPWVNTLERVLISGDAAMAGHVQDVILPTATYGDAFPYYGSTNTNPIVGAWVNTPSTAVTFQGSPCLRLQQTNFGVIAGINISVNAAIDIRVRWGVEMMVGQTSVLAPAIRQPAPYDALALRGYTAVVNQFPDAFPADYNGWDALGGVLKRVWSAVAPVVRGAGKMPGLGGAIASGVSAIGDLLTSPSEQAATKVNAHQTILPQSVPMQQPVQYQQQPKRARKARKKNAKGQRAPPVPSRKNRPQLPQR